MKNFKSDKTFQNALKDKLPKGACPSDVQYSENGCALIYIEGKPKVLGCPLCINPVKGQDKNGEPTINGKTMLRAEESGDMPLGTAPELAANLWLCPSCKMLDTSYLPKYITHWMQ